MKASEAKPLDATELETLRSLYQRWVLCSFPYKSPKGYAGKESGEADVARAMYEYIVDDCQNGKMTQDTTNAIKSRIDVYGEAELE